MGVGLTSLSAQANLSETSWIFHTQQEDFEFKRAGNVRGTPYVCLPELIRKLNLEMAYDPSLFEVLVVNPRRGNYALFKTYSSKVDLIFSQGNAAKFEKARKGTVLSKTLPQSTVSVDLSRRPEFVDSQLCVPIEFGDRVLRPLLSGKSPQTPLFLADSRKLDRVQVVIDVGHGGNDYGASKHGFREKDLLLLIAESLHSELKKLGINALMTREDDTFVTLSERARIANQSAASLFLSLHMNAHPSETKMKGFEIYVLSLIKDDSHGRAAVAREQQMIPDDLPDGLERAAADLRASANFEKSLEWSEKFRKALSLHFSPSSSQSIRMGPFYVLYAAQMPALLLELGYITHDSDRIKITDAESRQKLAQDLAKTIAQRLGSSHESSKTIRKSQP